MVILGVAIVLYFIDVYAAMIYVLLEGQLMVDPLYRGYVIVALLVLGIIKRYFFGRERIM